MKIKFLFAMALASFASTGFSQETTEGSFDSNGTKIHYASAGEGETVVLIHGWMSDCTMWGNDGKGNPKLSVEPLPGFRVVALDCRGHGKSDKPHDPKRYGAEMAADVVRLLDHLKVKKAHLVGYSMGAFIVGKVAAMAPERVSSAIYGGQVPLIEGAPASGSTETDLFAKAVDSGEDLGSYVLAVMPPDMPKLTPAMAKIAAQMMFKGKDVKALAAAGRSFDGLVVRAEDLRKCKAPALFIYGANETGHLAERVAHAREVLGQGEVKVVAGANHSTTLTKPEFGLTLVEFIKAHREK